MTDEALAARYAGGRDPADFRMLVERHSARVLRLVSSVLGPFRDTDAEETAQDVFVRVHDRIAQYRGDAQFSTWLYRVAYSVALNKRKRARLRLPHVPDDVLRSLQAAGGPHDDAEAGERTAQLTAAIELLPAVYRTAIYLHYWQDTSIDDIAHLLNAPANTIKSYLFRARARLAESLQGKGFES
jgi:RNA polymerase sigma-70 factor (ECF subfamily)